MKHHGLASLAAAATLAAALFALNGCNETSTDAPAANAPPSRPAQTLLAGTTFNVVLGGTVSSENANVGDAWHGTVQENVATRNGGTIAAGSPVQGVVVGVTAAKRGSRAMLDLGVRQIGVNGRDTPVTASSEAVIAGSTRARNLGAIAGSAAAGALIGKVVGDGKNAAVGGLIGGGAATAVVAGSKGYQVVLSNGTVMSFTVNQAVAVR